MISPELLRRFSFFGHLTSEELRQLAMISDEGSCQEGTTLFKEGEQANRFYFLMKGSVDLYFTQAAVGIGQTGADFHIGEINAGEPFGLSALLEPYQYTSTARSGQASQYLSIGAKALRGHLQQDDHLAAILMQKLAQAFAERLRFTRIQLAAARG